MNAKIFHGLDVIVSINFIISVLFLITGTLLSLSDYSLFELNEELYGEFISNFKMTLLYVALSELIICTYCFFSKRTEFLMLLGLFLVLMVGSIHFYSEINSVELDADLSLFFLYTGLSHIAFGAFANFKKRGLTADH